MRNSLVRYAPETPPGNGNQSGNTPFPQPVGPAHCKKHASGQAFIGELQRNIIASSQMVPGCLRLADKPTDALDISAVFLLVNLIARLNQRQGDTLIVAILTVPRFQVSNRSYETMDGYPIPTSRIEPCLL